MRGQGSNSVSVRINNEKIVLHSLRKLKKASRSDLVKITSLSFQTLATITTSLAKRQLIHKIGKQINGTGQPSYLYSLNPQAAFSIGVNIGRRYLMVFLIDFTGEVLYRKTKIYTYPEPEEVIELIALYVEESLAKLTEEQKKCFHGIGVGIPFHLDSWEKELDLSDEVVKKWENFDLEKKLQALFPYPIFFKNDVWAATLAELLLGQGTLCKNFLYINIGTFIGGGVVFNGQIISGRIQHAGNIGVMPVSKGRFNKDHPKNYIQLISRASLNTLKKILNRKGFKVIHDFYDLQKWVDSNQAETQSIIADWIDDISEAIALACLSSISLLDFEAIVIDSSLLEEFSKKIVLKTRSILSLLIPRGSFYPNFIPVTSVRVPKSWEVPSFHFTINTFPRTT